MTAIEKLRPDPAGLPWPPTWRIRGEGVRELSPDALTEKLAQLGGPEEHYWVLHQGPVNPGSLRQALANLDSDATLAAALQQMMSRPDAPESAVFQCLPAQVAAGILFTRHPLRPDLDQAVVEGRVEGSADQERLILHPDGALAFHSGDHNRLDSEIGAGPFSRLSADMVAAYTGPRAGEWVWDGARLWLIQALPVGTLPEPKEAWTRRAGLGFSVQAISPLWYTLMGRWLKTAYWRPRGEQFGWQALAKVEPYRRIHSHFYTNSQFLRALQESLGRWSLTWALPPAWRPSHEGSAGPTGASPGKLRAVWLRFRLALLERKLSGVTLVDQASDQSLWLALMSLDKLGEALASIEGRLAYELAPGADSTATLSDREVAALLSDLPALRSGQISVEDIVQRHGTLAAGSDPVWPRFGESGQDVMALLGRVEGFEEHVLQQVADEASLSEPGWADLRARALGLRRRLGGALRRVLRRMSAELVVRDLLRHPDDVFFLYFDELWACWQGQPRDGLAELIGERKVRYLSDAHAGPADWILDQVGYGGAELGQATNRDLVRGYELVPGQVSGRVQRLVSGWQLNQVEPGDVVVMDQCDPAWLPWLTQASALVISHRDESDPAVWLARAARLPAIWGVIDATRSLVDGSRVEVNADQGQVSVISPPSDG